MSGLIGLPNAGKSTFLARVSRPRGRRSPIIRSRRCTPSSAWCALAAPISWSPIFPGLIEGAHEGAGLGTRFLGHAERTSVILHLIDGTEVRRRARLPHDPRRACLLRPGLAEKPEILALNKSDAHHEGGARAQDAPRSRKRPDKGVRHVGRFRRRVSMPCCDALARTVETSRGKRKTTTRARAELGAVSDHLANAKRVVVKVGSTLLVDAHSRRAETRLAGEPGRRHRRAQKDGKEIIIVSSGAIALGRRALEAEIGRASSRRKPGRRRCRTDPARASLCRCVPRT